MPKQISNWMDRTYSTKEELTEAMLNATKPNHPTDHKFVSDPKFPEGSICERCGWADYNGPPLGCGHNVCDHILNYIQLLGSSEGDNAFATYPHGNRQLLSRYLLGGHTIAQRIMDIFGRMWPFSLN